MKDIIVFAMYLIESSVQAGGFQTFLLTSPADPGGQQRQKDIRVLETSHHWTLIPRSLGQTQSGFLDWEWKLGGHVSLSPPGHGILFWEGIYFLRGKTWALKSCCLRRVPLWTNSAHSSRWSGGSTRSPRDRDRFHELDLSLSGLDTLNMQTLVW